MTIDAEMPTTEKQHFGVFFHTEWLPARARQDHTGWKQLLYKFPNGYGASVIRGPYSYGGPEGRFELAVMVQGADGHTHGPIYDTPITDDVLGWLTPEQVGETLNRIASLPYIEYT